MMNCNNNSENSQVINAAVITANKKIAPPDLYQQVFDVLLKYKNVEKKAIRIEIANGVAEKGELEDLPILITFLREEKLLGNENDAADISSFTAYAILKMGVRERLEKPLWN